MTIHWARVLMRGKIRPDMAGIGRNKETRDEKWHTTISNVEDQLPLNIETSWNIHNIWNYHFLFLWCSVFLNWVQWWPRIIIECSRQDANQISYSDSQCFWNYVLLSLRLLKLSIDWLFHWWIDGLVERLIDLWIAWAIDWFKVLSQICTSQT